MLKDLSISKKLVLSFSLFFMLLLSLGGMSFSRRCSLYVLLTIFTPPDSQDFALLGSWL